MLFLIDDIYLKRDNECRFCIIYIVCLLFIIGKIYNICWFLIIFKFWIYCNIDVCNYEFSFINFSIYNNIYEIGGGVIIIF